MQILADAGLVSSKKIRNRVFYKLNDEQVRAFLAALSKALETPKPQ
jgi:DNA-binding transcriptional ArsR family regulator